MEKYLTKEKVRDILVTLHEWGIGGITEEQEKVLEYETNLVWGFIETDRTT